MVTTMKEVVRNGVTYVNYTGSEQRPIEARKQTRDAIGTGVQGIVYVIHFSRPICHAKHYIGYVLCDNDANIDHAIAQRMTLHSNGRGSKLLAYAKAHNIQWWIAQLYVSDNVCVDVNAMEYAYNCRVFVCNHIVDRNFERSLKDRNGAGKFCVVCKDEHKFNHEMEEKYPYAHA
jgi:hypothetical protein